VINESFNNTNHSNQTIFMKTNSNTHIRIWWSMILLLLIFTATAYAQTPVSRNGQLRVIGTKLCNQFGSPIQLRGMSTHGIQWYGWGSCLTEASLDALANDWGADILRISLYVQEGGYETDPAGFTAQVSRLIEEATERGMYALVDWHQLTPGDPNANLASAKTFFTNIANAHKNKVNIIYDICNEPNGVTWSRIKTYADQIIPVIRNIDADAPIFIGTHAWASLGVSDGRTAQDIVDNPVNFSNIMYTFHFYAADHRDAYLNQLSWAADRLPIFVTEFGSQEASGDGPNDFTMTQRFIDLMRTKKIGWTNWNYSDDFRTGAVWKPGTCSAGPWTTTNLKASGTWIRERMLTPADDFPTGNNIPPSVSISSPSNGATFTAPASITINANASDADGTVSRVEFYNGSTKLGEDLSSPYSFSWTNVAAGSYTLTAKAYDNMSAVTTSGAVSITVNGGGSLPAPWSTSDIGAVGVAGSASYSSGTFNVNGSGADIWNAADEFRYVYQTLTGNGSIVARVTSLTNTNAWAKAGVMIRESLAANSTHAATVVTPANGVSFPRRTTTGALSTSATVAGQVVPKYVKIERSGSTFTSSYSNDGITFTTVGTVSISMSSTVYVGLCLTSHNDGVLASASFTNVAVTTPAPPCPAVIASADDGNVAANVLDNDLNTRWSASGDGQWIQFCLSSVSSISGVQIAFFKGNERQSIFDVLVSSDASTWSTAASGLRSSGTSLALQTFTFPAVTGKYVRIVGHGNTLNLWNSYTEVRINSAVAAGGGAEVTKTSETSGFTSHPNPATDQVTITYSVKEKGRVILTLYNSSSNSSQRMIDEEKQAGVYETVIDLKSLPTGLHFIKLFSNNKLEVQKLIKQ
jgi:endoglucanase